MSSAGQRVLLVEDEGSVRRLLAAMLVRGGYRVTDVDDGDLALGLIEARATEFDLAVIDLNLPGASGVELACRIRSSAADLPVLMISGHFGDAEPLLLGLGVHTLDKPFGLSALLEKVTEVLTGHAAATSTESPDGSDP